MLPEMLSRTEMETRRLAAAEMLKAGGVVRVAREMGVSRQTGYRWLHRYLQGGEDGLRLRRATGRPSRLSADQLEAIGRMLRDGSRWTAVRLAEEIKRRYKVRYHKDHALILMRKLRSVPSVKGATT